MQMIDFNGPGNKDGPGKEKTRFISVGHDRELLLFVARMGIDEGWDPQWDDSKFEAGRGDMYVLVVDVPVDPDEYIAQLKEKLKKAKAN